MGLEGARDFGQAGPRQSFDHRLMDCIVRPHDAVQTPFLGFIDLMKRLPLCVDAGHASRHALAAVEMLNEPATEGSVQYVRDQEYGCGINTSRGGVTAQAARAASAASAMASGSADAIKAITRAFLSITTTPGLQGSNSHGCRTSGRQNTTCGVASGDAA